MDWARNKLRRSRLLRGDGPPASGPVDEEIRALGGLTTALDMEPEVIQARKAVISEKERIVELTRENGRLRQEIAFLKPQVVAFEQLIPTMSAEISGFNSYINQVNQFIQQKQQQQQQHRK